MRPLVLLACVALGACGTAGATRPAPPADPIETTSAGELYRRGVEFNRRGDFVRAEQYLAAAITRGYPQREALLELVTACLASSRLRAALNYALPYLARHPDAWPLRYLVATVYLGLGETDPAQQELDQLLRDRPSQPLPHYLLAVLLRDQRGDLAGARREFARYLELAPDAEHAAEATAALRPPPPSDATPGEPAATGPAATALPTPTPTLAP